MNDTTIGQEALDLLVSDFFGMALRHMYHSTVQLQFKKWVFTF